MKILHIVSGTGVNGATLYAVKVAELLARRGHEIVLLKRPHFDVDITATDIRTIDSTLKRSASEIRRIGAFCAAERIDVIHTHMSSAHAFGALLRLFYRVPCVATAHKLNLQLHWAINDRVLCHNDESMRYMRRFNLVPRSRLRLVPPFIDEREIELERLPRQQLLERFRLPAGRPILIAIGHFIARKGLIDIVEALPRVIAAGHDPIVVFCGWAGDPHYRAGLVARIGELGLSEHIRWFERVSDEDRIQLARCADLFVQASRVDTGPLVVLEAMAQSLPVVGTRCGTMPEFITPGATGELVPIADSAALGETITRMLADYARLQRMGTAGLERFRQLYTATKNIGLIEQAYAEAQTLVRSPSSAKN